MLGDQRLIRVGSSLSADGVQPELQLPLYLDALHRESLVVRGHASVKTDANSNFGPCGRVVKNPRRFRFWRTVFRPFSGDIRLWTQLILFGQEDSSYCRLRQRLLALPSPTWPDILCSRQSTQ